MKYQNRKMESSNIEYHSQYFIVEKMTHNAIIGIDDLDKNGIIIGKFQIGEELISFYKFQY